jgi:hypothetical protein
MPDRHDAANGAARGAAPHCFAFDLLSQQREEQNRRATVGSVAAPLHGLANYGRRAVLSLRGHVTTLVALASHSRRARAGGSGTHVGYTIKAIQNELGTSHARRRGAPCPRKTQRRCHDVRSVGWLLFPRRALRVANCISPFLMINHEDMRAGFAYQARQDPPFASWRDRRIYLSVALATGSLASDGSAAARAQR